MKYKYSTIGILLSIIFYIGCNKGNNQNAIERPFADYSMKNDSIQKEIDRIYTLLAYSLVLKDWQSDSIPRYESRGYNIGTILVNEDKEVVHWGLNCINATSNVTQHGEVRAITSYLDSLKSYNLKGFTLYTTLEPCAMCSGMATMTNIERVVYGQKDVDFSGALDRLSLNSKKFGGFKPYPRSVISDPGPTKYREDLDVAFKHFLKIEDEKYIAKFLSSKKARKIYENARNEFLNYKVIFPENQIKYKLAKEFLENIKI